MNRKIRSYLSACFILTAFFLQADPFTDSLYQVLRSKVHDTARIDAFNELCWPVYSSVNSDSSLKYGTLALNLSSKIGDDRRMAIACRRLGITYTNLSDHQKALFYQNKSFEICSRIGDKRGMASSLNNIGVIYLNISDLKRAIDYNLRSQKIQEEIKDSAILFESYYNTGLLFKDIGDFEKGLFYYKKAYSIAKYQNSGTKMAYALGGIGTIVKTTVSFDSARACYEKALSHFEKENNIHGLTQTYVNLGAIYTDRKDMDTIVGLRKSLSYYLKALEIIKQYDNSYTKSDIIGNVGFSYSKLGKYDSAIYYSKKAVELATESNNQNELVFSYATLSQSYGQIGDYKQALLYLQKHNSLKERIYNDEKRKEVLQKQLQFEFDKKLLADSLEMVQEQKSAQTKIELANTKLKQEKFLRYSLIVGIMFVIIFLFFLYNRFKATQEQNKIIEEQKQQVVAQKDIIEVKQKEIVASINYAKRIQNTLLVKDNELTQHLKDHF
ncbi:MAG: protein serine/threonine phosphatase, partial [Bacteroidetes bacterium]|nr:protein serine/threonine phosphatase [Bacteroidota bacterium]